MNTHDTWTEHILHQLTDRFEPWLSCNDCFAHSDSVLEDLLDRDMPLPDDFKAHLRGCAACRDEMQTLAELAAGTHGLAPAAARAKLDAQLTLA